jgi:hypothetical protein
VARLTPYQSSRSFLEITPESFNALEEYIRWAEVETPRNMAKGLDALVFHMAIANQGESRRLSFGPYDPMQQNSNAAWQLPVRRITGNYYTSWKVRRVSLGVWEVYNDSREAYFIEFGISEVGWGANRYVPARRIRRPVRKLAFRRTMEIMMRTQAYHRIWVNIYSNPKERHRHGKNFTQYVQSPAGVHGTWEDVTPRQAAQTQANNRRGSGRFTRLRRTASGQFQRRTTNPGGSYGGPMLGRRLP